MERIVADCNNEWIPLSEEHKELMRKIQNLLDQFNTTESVNASQSVNASHLVSGFYGTGKTMFLLLIVKESLNRNIVPIYILADDIIENCKGNSPQELGNSINEYVQKIYESVISRSEENLFRLVKNSNGNIKGCVYSKVLSSLPKGEKDLKYVVLVDEMEDRYNKLKEMVGVDPLREWLDNKTYLKFIAMTPTGIYDLGGADENRLSKEFRMPRVSLEFIRSNFGLQASYSNLLWWLSRGIPRQIVKNFPVIENLKEKLSDSDIYEILQPLDRIGKEPVVVKAINLPESHSKINKILSLYPQKSDKKFQGLKISKELYENEGMLSEILQKVFDLNTESEKTVSLLLAKYIRYTAISLSDDNFDAYIPIGEIPDLLKLSIDNMLEADYKRQEVQNSLLKIWDVDKSAETKNIQSNLISYIIKNNIQGFMYDEGLENILPFTISEIRQMFPFLISNPLISADPKEVIQKLEGKGQPIIVGENFSFFASLRDLKNFIKNSDTFKAQVLEDGNWRILAYSESSNSHPDDIKDDPFINWLQESRKVVIKEIPGQLSNFLLSLYGIADDNHLETIEKIVMEKKETMIKRKFSIYYDSLRRWIDELKLNPITFFKNKGELNGASHTWGSNQLKEEKVAIAGLSLVFEQSLTGKEKEDIVSIRNLFRTTGKKGLLAQLKVGKGRPTLADDMLLRDNYEQVLDSPIIQELKNFWNENEKNMLKRLVYMLSLNDFKKLGSNTNESRFLEALWRVKQDDFELGDIDGLRLKISDLKDKINHIIEGSTKIQNDFGLYITIENNKDKIINLDIVNGLDKFLEIKPDNKFMKFIYEIFGEGILQEESDVNSIDKKFSQLEDLIKNISDNHKKLEDYLSGEKEGEMVLKFMGVKFSELKNYLNDFLHLDGESELMSGDAVSNIKSLNKNFEDMSILIFDLGNNLKEILGMLKEKQLIEAM